MERDPPGVLHCADQSLTAAAASAFTNPRTSWAWQGRGNARPISREPGGSRRWKKPRVSLGLHDIGEALHVGRRLPRPRAPPISSRDRRRAQPRIRLLDQGPRHQTREDAGASRRISEASARQLQEGPAIAEPASGPAMALRGAGAADRLEVERFPLRYGLRSCHGDPAIIYSATFPSGRQTQRRNHEPAGQDGN